VIPPLKKADQPFPTNTEDTENMEELK
jgi:hypothetical protein